MEKVKIFCDCFSFFDDNKAAERWINKINDWIKQTPGIEISKVTFNSCQEAHFKPVLMQVSIFYNKSHFPTHKNRTRLKLFIESISRESDREEMEAKYEDWFKNQTKKLLRPVGEGVCAVTEFEIKQIHNVLSPFNDSLALLVVYTDCSDANEEAKIKKGPPPPIVLPRREE